MPKLKLKKGVQKILGIVFIVGLFLSIGLFSYLKITNQKKYEQTYEYKLLNIGYNSDEVDIITKNYKDVEIDYILKNEKNVFYLDIIQEKYFIYDKFYDYLDYFNNHKSILPKEIVEIVNTNINKDFYTDIKTADINKKELMLVNKFYYLESSYVPENLISVPLSYAYGEFGSVKVTEDTYNAFLNLWKASNDAGYYLIINSAYRTYDDQQSVYDNYKKQGTDYADKIAARPGHSEHQTGYSLDIFEKGYSSSNFEESDSYRWLLENAHKYGFIQRYPQDKVTITGYNFESWHYRYVGIEAATYIYENNITFDEYYAYFIE